MLSDLCHTLRSLSKSRGFTTLAVLIVALGIGAATTMFSTANALVLRPIAQPDPDRLVAVYETNLPRNQPFFSVSVPNYADWKNRAQSWEALAAIGWRTMNLQGDGARRPRRQPAARPSRNESRSARRAEKRIAIRDELASSQ